MKRILILLSFLAISCQSNSGEMPRQAGQASNELMDGLEAMHHVRFAEARALFVEGIEKDPNCASCYLNLGNAYFHDSNFGKARWSYEMGLKINPINSDLKNNNNVNKAYIDGYIELPKNNLIDFINIFYFFIF